MYQQDVGNLGDVKLLIDTFYEMPCEDETLGNIFNEGTGNKWPEHLEKMYRFRQTVLLDQHTYFGAPFPPHANLPLGHLHFEKCFALFHTTVDDLFKGKKQNRPKGVQKESMRCLN